MALNSTIRARIEKPTPEELGVVGAASTLPNTFGNNWNDPAFRQNHNKRQVLRAEQTGALASSYSRISVKPPQPKPDVTCKSAAELLAAIETTRAAVVQGLHSPPAPKSLADELSGTFSVDDKALRYFAFTTEQIRESATETIRTRKVSITFFVSDETILIQEKRVVNSGLNGGTVLKRQRVPISRDDAERRDTNIDAGHITLNDIHVGSSINILSRRYFVYACDGFTREFLIAIGADVQPDGPEPDDSYLVDYRVNRVDFRAKGKSFETKDLSATHESLTSKGKCAQHYPEEALRAQRFVRDSGKVLSFNGLWNDEDAQPGGLLRTLEVRYYVEDDTISMVERTNPLTQKEVVQKTFLSRRRVPVSGKAAKHVELTFANRVNGQREHFLGSSDRYYEISDLAIGAEMNIFGRKVKLYSCDGYTREFLKNAGIPVGDDLDVSEMFPKPKTRPVIVPPPTGFGTHEDSLASCSIALKPPKKDLRGFHEHGNNSLRFEMRLHNPESPEDNLRKFLLTYYLADGEIQITELAIRNTGFTGGRFMKKQKVEKTSGQRDFITAGDLQVGAVVNIAGFNFKITDLDQHSSQYLEFEDTKGRHPDELTQVSPERLQQLVAKFREFVQVRFYTNTEAFRAFDRDHDGFVSLHEMIEALKSNLITDREEEAAALVHLFDKSDTNQVSYKDFMEAVAIHKDPVIPTETMRVQAEPCKAKAETATRAAKRKVVLRQLHDRFEARCLNVFETFRVLSTMPRAFRGRQAVELAALTNGSRDTAITPVQLRRGLAEVFGVTLNTEELAIVLEFFFPTLPESLYDAESDRSLQYAVRLPEFQQKIVAMSAVGHLQA